MVKLNASFLMWMATCCVLLLARDLFSKKEEDEGEILRKEGLGWEWEGWERKPFANSPPSSSLSGKTHIQIRISLSAAPPSCSRAGVYGLCYTSCSPACVPFSAACRVL